MTRVSPEPPTEVSNGASPRDMTSTAAEQGGDTEKPDAPKAEPAATSAPSPPAPGAADNRAVAAEDAAPPPASKSPPRKRRKVNHACIYCRRSHMTCDLNRPCTRCVKRNIGHLCHDEPREPTSKRPKSEQQQQQQQQQDSKNADASPATATAKLESHTPEPATQAISHRTKSQDAGLTRAAAAAAAAAAPSLPQNSIASTPAIAQPALDSSNSHSYYNDWNPSSDPQFQDMHAFHPSYMFNTSEVSNEYNLLNDFLTNSLMDDGSLYPGDDIQQLFTDPSLTNTMGLSTGNPTFLGQPVNNDHMPADPAVVGRQIARPTSGIPDKMREKYYLTAADPAGTDSPEERMEKLLKAKVEAGMLKPFNYVNGYQRLSQYMDKHMAAHSRAKILRELGKFRPKFRERMQRLTDYELVRVEMWFERCLMDYDRVFSSMAIPACCWRRTGEIFRGNREMAELLNVPIEQLRDGKLAVHDIMSEASVVSYWEKFGAIAFDKGQKAILTSCFLKSTDPNSTAPEIRCCFSFTIKRDKYDIPAVIVGNFLPVKLRES